MTLRIRFFSHSGNPSIAPLWCNIFIFEWISRVFLPPALGTIDPELESQSLISKLLISDYFFGIFILSLESFVFLSTKFGVTWALALEMLTVKWLVLSVKMCELIRLTLIMPKHDRYESSLLLDFSAMVRWPAVLAHFARCHFLIVLPWYDDLLCWHRPGRHHRYF